MVISTIAMANDCIVVTDNESTSPEWMLARCDIKGAPSFGPLPYSAAGPRDESTQICPAESFPATLTT
jgi:hypothetical protein